MVSIDIVAIVLLLAALIGAVNDRCVRLPAPIGMLLGSLVVVLVIVVADRVLRLHIMQPIRRGLAAADLPHVFLGWLLALLLFAGSLQVDLPALRQSRRMIFVLATVGVILSAAVFGFGLWTLLALTGREVSLAWCFVLGAILAPTDAVVVETLLGRTRLPVPTRSAIIGESLFNDGAGVVLFLVALRLTEGAPAGQLIGHGRLAIAMSEQLAGGAAVGFLSGLLAAWTIHRVADDAVRIIVSLALVVGCYRLAIVCHVSGPIAAVSAGLLLGRTLHRGGEREETGVAASEPDPILEFWSLLSRVLNLGLFLGIGAEVMALVVTWWQLATAAATVPIALVARMVSVAVPLAGSGRPVRTVARQTAVLTWAGMRGGISIALALTLPAFRYRTELLVICYAVVLFSIVVLGLTLPGLLRRLYADEVGAAVGAESVTRVSGSSG